MTINQIIKLLEQSRVNSKRQTIEMLQNATLSDLYELKLDCDNRIKERIQVLQGGSK